MRIINKQNITIKIFIISLSASFKPLLLITLFILLIACNKYESDKIIPKAVKGELDLSGWNFDKNGLIKLKGEWEFYWNHYITPDDVKNNNIPKKTGFINLPGVWYNQKINGKKLHGYGYCSYRLIIKNIKTDKSLSIKIGEMLSAYTLFINGKKIVTAGKPGKNKKKSTPLFYIDNFDLGIPDKNLDIIINISNYHYFTGGIPYSINIGYTKNIQNNEKILLTINNFISGCLFIIAVLFIFLFLFRKEEKSNLYFSILCIVTFCMLIFYINYPIANFFASIINSQIFYYLQVMPYLIFVIALSLYIYSLFKNEFSKIVLNLIIITNIIINLTAIIIHIITGYFCTLLLGTISAITGYFVYMYLIYVSIKALINKRENAGLSLIVNIALLLAFSNEVIILMTLFETVSIFSYVLLFFILIQTYILSYRYSKSFTKIKKLSSKLKKTNIQLKDININLEKKVEERTKQLKEAHAQKTNFFINIAHETKTPLTLINNYVEKFIKKYGSSEEILLIKNNINRLTKDMVNFLDIQKLERGQVFYKHDQIINISNILLSKIQLFREKAWHDNIRIIASNIKKDLLIKMDPYAIDRVINNLLDNAIKYNKTDGIIETILKENNNNIILIIKDTGIGISKNLQKNIFYPYYQISHEKRNIQGIGMGLTIVKNIIKEVNGTIDIESKLDEGTTFTITFKKHLMKKDEKINNKIKLSIPIDNKINIKLKEEKFEENKKNILLVEDNIEMLSYLQDSFYDKYNIFMAKNGQKALNKLNFIPKPNIIISDIMMDKMDGYKFYDELHKINNYNDIPFIFLTALTSNNEKIKGLKKGAVDYIYKPFSIKVLHNKINSLLRIQENQKINNFEIINNEMQKILYEESYYYEEKKVNINNICTSYNISKKEEVIINYLLKGFKYKDISIKLNISYNTVKKRIRSIYKKLKIYNRIELINKINN